MGSRQVRSEEIKLIVFDEIRAGVRWVSDHSRGLRDVGNELECGRVS